MYYNRSPRVGLHLRIFIQRDPVNMRRLLQFSKSNLYPLNFIIFNQSSLNFIFISSDICCLLNGNNSTYTNWFYIGLNIIFNFIYIYLLLWGYYICTSTYVYWFTEDFFVFSFNSSLANHLFLPLCLLALGQLFSEIFIHLLILYSIFFAFIT